MLWSTRLTAILGPVSLCPTEAMIFDRTSGVRLSTTGRTVYAYRACRNSETHVGSPSQKVWWAKERLGMLRAGRWMISNAVWIERTRA